MRGFYGHVFHLWGQRRLGVTVTPGFQTHSKWGFGIVWTRSAYPGGDIFMLTVFFGPIHICFRSK